MTNEQVMQYIKEHRDIPWQQLEEIEQRLANADSSPCEELAWLCLYLPDSACADHEGEQAAFRGDFRAAPKGYPLLGDEMAAWYRGYDRITKLGNNAALTEAYRLRQIAGINTK